MKGYRVRRLAWAMFVAFMLISSCNEGGLYAFQTSGEAGAGARRPWLMISLSPEKAARPGANALSVIKRFSGNPDSVVCHFSEITRELVAKIDPEFIVLSPQARPWCRYSGSTGVALQNFLWLVPILAEEMKIPILGICGGHQALALAFGGRVGPIRGVGCECMPYSRDRQTGVVRLTVTAPDPIFRGIHQDLHIAQSHYDEVKLLPPGFVLLASEKLSPIQIMRHPILPVYGIQGHPERFKIAATFNAAIRGLEPLLPRLLSFDNPLQRFN
jgi:GMP synthase (glutamine-hydrolysing)